VSHDDDGVRTGVFDRVEDVPRNYLAGSGPLNDAVSDVAAGEHTAGFVVAPHVVLQDPRVRATDGDYVRVLGVLYVVESRLEVAGVLQVVPQEFDERLVHSCTATLQEV